MQSATSLLLLLQRPFELQYGHKENSSIIYVWVAVCVLMPPTLMSELCLCVHHLMLPTPSDNMYRNENESLNATGRALMFIFR